MERQDFAVESRGEKEARQRTETEGEKEKDASSKKQHAK